MTTQILNNGEEVLFRDNGQSLPMNGARTWL